MFQGKMASRCLFTVAVGALCVMLPTRAAFAGWLPPEGTQVVVITAESAAGTETKSWPLQPVVIDERYQWNLPGVTSENPMVLSNGSSIGGLGAGIEVDPALTLNFTVTAGAVDTTFTITTAVLGFAPINNGQAFATAAVTVTDNNSNTSMVSGLQPGGKAYQARYNAGVPWANLVGMVMSAVDDSATGDERQPSPTGRTVIPGLVSSIQTEFKFTLTAFDSASGTSRFDIIPEPATLGLLAVGGLALLRRRSR